MNPNSNSQFLFSKILPNSQQRLSNFTPLLQEYLPLFLDFDSVSFFFWIPSKTPPIFLDLLLPFVAVPSSFFFGRLWLIPSFLFDLLLLLYFSRLRVSVLHASASVSVRHSRLRRS